MDIAPLNIDLVRQKPKSDDCVRCVAQMVFNYFDDPITKEQLWRRLHVYKKHSGFEGTFYQDLGTLAAKRGYVATLYHYDWTLWDGDTAEAAKSGSKALVTALKKLQSKKKGWTDKRILDKDIRFVDSGGEYTVALPQLARIDHYLKARIPVIITVKGEAMSHDPEEVLEHAILVVGKKGDTYHIKDPYYPVKTVSGPELLFSWSRANGAMLVLQPDPKAKKKKKKPSTQLDLMTYGTR